MLNRPRRKAPGLALALAAGVAAFAGPAAAADEAAQTRDLRCVLVVAITGAQNPSPEAKQGLIGGIGYYMGRLKGRDPAIDLGGRLTALAKGLQPETLRPDFARCGEEMKAFGVEAQEVGRALQALATAPPKDATD